MGTKLTGKEIHDAAREDAGLANWRVLLNAMHTRFATGDFATGLALVNAIGQAAEEANHHPDLDLRYPHLDVKLSSHDVGGLTERDLALARRISELATEAGVSARPEKATLLELALDTTDRAAIAPFWRAVFGLPADAPGGDDEVVDPDGVVDTLWFQDTEPHDEPRQRFHLDLWVPHDVVEPRIAESLDAGGTLVSDAAAPSFWVLADAEGNKVCLCTWQERD